ncbi:hypothetical protein LTS02_015792 [Friedmanniomyces endolithicus]|nr:hypothetical protein LTS02_015792 [Friedmanniomyces endolithicus]
MLQRHGGGAYRSPEQAHQLPHSKVNANAPATASAHIETLLQGLRSVHVEYAAHRLLREVLETGGPGRRPSQGRSPPPLSRAPRRFRDRSPSTGPPLHQEAVSPAPPPPDLGTFDRAWILDRLEKLNSFGKITLTDAQRYDVCISVVEPELALFLNHPLTPTTYDQITPVLANAVLYAKAVTYAPGSAIAAQYQEPQQPAMATPLLGQFLVQVNGFVQARNETGLADWIALEPPFNEQYGA